MVINAKKIGEAFRKNFIVGLWVAVITFILGIVIGLVNSLGILKLNLTGLFSSLNVPLTTPVTSTVGTKIIEFFNGIFGVGIIEIATTVFILAISAGVIMLVGGVIYSILEGLGALKWVNQKSLELKFFLRFIFGTILIGLILWGWKVPPLMTWIGFGIWAVLLTIVMAIFHKATTKTGGILAY